MSRVVEAYLPEENLYRSSSSRFDHTLSLLRGQGICILRAVNTSEVAVRVTVYHSGYLLMETGQLSVWITSSRVIKAGTAETSLLRKDETHNYGSLFLRKRTQKRMEVTGLYMVVRFARRF